jgi:hypothetical protein
MFKYSENEMKIIRYFRMDDVCSRIAPDRLFEMLAVQSFLNKDKSIYSDALWNAMNYTRHSNHRNTPFYESLIETY